MKTAGGLAAACVLAFATRATAQTPVVRVGGNIQTVFSAVTGDSTAAFNPHAQPLSLFEARRLRLIVDARIGDRITATVVPDIANGELRVFTAWARLLLASDRSSGIGFTVGQERKPFNRYENTSSTLITVIERGARLRGFSSPLAQDNLLYANGYVAMDIGASLDAWLLEGRVALKASVFNGAGEGVPDVNNAKSWAGRVTATVASDGRGRPKLRVGAAYIARDRGIVTDSTCTTGCAFFPDSSRRSSAMAFEAEWGDYRPGLHVVADVSTGDHLGQGHWTYDTGRNFGNLYPGAPDSAITTFRAVQVVASWRFQRDNRSEGLVRIIEPAVRVDVTDPSTARAGDDAMLLTGALSLHFSSLTVMRAGVDLYRYHDATGALRSARAVRVMWQVAY